MPHEQDGGAVEFLRDLRRDDADQSRTPIFAAQHDDVAVRAAARGDLLLRAAVHLVAQLLALEVVFAEFARQLVNLRAVLGGEQFERAVRIPHPARGVDARRDGKRERLGGDLLFFARQKIL